MMNELKWESPHAHASWNGSCIVFWKNRIFVKTSPMKLILIFTLYIPFSLFAQKQDSIVKAIDEQVTLIDRAIYKEQIKRDTVKNINEEYEQYSVVAFYENKKLRKIRIDSGDGAAGDISSGTEYYYINGELVLMFKGTSYFMAGGCSEIEKVYFFKNDFIQLISTTDCKGEDARVMNEYFGGYSFGVKDALETIKRDTEGVSLTK